MKNISYTIKFYSYWHPGGKDGANPQIDNAVLKDKNNMPYIGGKTIKGLIKDGARFVNELNSSTISGDFIKNIFGEVDTDYKADKAANPQNKFTSAVLKEKVKKEFAPLLYHTKERTALEADKQSKKHSLRTSEVVIPLELQGKIENFTGDKIMLELAMKAVKKLGEKRFRGLGRCEITIDKN